MRRYTFFLNIEGLGDNPKEAWEDAVERMLGAIKEYGDPPGMIVEPDGISDAIVGCLREEPFQEFGIDHGEEPEE